MAELLKQELGIETDLIQGEAGEFTVWVDKDQVAQKGWLGFPSDKKVLEAVRAALTK
ncbi:MAG: Rdx family protein [Acidobacteria bacterium]|nr:Rdx family protein [Acidobacteriota bacterium]